VSEDKKEAKGKQDDHSILKTARRRSRDGATYWRENWDAAEDDLENLAGEQWDEDIKRERENDGRPCLTNNVLPTFVDQVLGDQRQNRPSIKVSARSTTLPIGPDQELKIPSRTGSKKYTLSEVMSGVVKDIEYSCDAETSYDNAFEASAGSGMGYLRVRTDWVDDQFEQEILIESIENQFAVIMDPSAKKSLYQDMAWCLVDDQMDREEFEEKYPDASVDPVNDENSDESGVWFTENTVKVCEYFTRECVIREMLLMTDGRTLYLDEAEPILDELAEEGITIHKRRKVKAHKVIWRKITGNDVLEGPIELPWSTIPIIPVWGKQIVIKKRKIFRSVIRHSKDAQRMSNYWDSAMTESVALAPKAPFVGAEGHIEGRETEWEEANTTNKAIQTYVPQYPGDPGPQRSQPAAVPNAELVLGQTSVDKIKSTLGMFDASVGAAGNETSGRAINARQRQGDRGSFAFIDNLTKSITRVGQLVVEAFPKINDTERTARLKFQDDSEDYVKLNEQIFDDESGEWVTINDLGVAKYDVVVSTGPAFATQRIEAAESMIQFAQAVPAAAAVMADLIAQNMDWPGADVIAERLKKIVPSNVLTGEEREKLQEDMPEQEGPTPEQQLQMAEIELKQTELKVGAEQAEADKMKADADIAKAQADMLEAQLATEEAQSKLKMIEDAANGGNQFSQQVREFTAQAIAELLGGNSPK